MRKIIILLTGICINSLALGCSGQIKTCFTPGQSCDSEIVNQINESQHEILVQAYSFTSAPVAGALNQAHKRGVDVKVILDKSQVTQRYSSATYLNNQDIPIWVDSKVAIAHNKVIIIDNKETITGSYNFTKSAQMRNAENVLFIQGACVANAYSENWHARQLASVKLQDYQKSRR